ncbi:MAG: hypothetical protein HFF90_11020 [Oscillibacter sp.]|nr:hypothetical protein [Oscillibacter sp.]MCI9116989.1 hypothetical protein [Acutalibacter sp.]
MGGNEMDSSKTKDRYEIYLERKRTYLQEWRKRNPDKVKEYSKWAYEKLKRQSFNKLKEDNNHDRGKDDVSNNPADSKGYGVT